MIFSRNSNSADPVLLDLGQKAPFAGYLLDPDIAQKSRILIIEGEGAKKLNESYAKSILQYEANELLYRTQVQTVMDQNDKLSKSLQSSQSLNDWQKIGLVVLGIGLTCGAIWAEGQLHK